MFRKNSMHCHGLSINNDIDIKIHILISLKIGHLWYKYICFSFKKSPEMSCETIWIERKIDMTNCGITGILPINLYTYLIQKIY